MAKNLVSCLNVVARIWANNPIHVFISQGKDMSALQGSIRTYLHELICKIYIHGAGGGGGAQFIGE